MSIAAAMPPAGSAIALRRIARLLQERTGQSIGPARAWRLETSLAPLMRDRGMTNLDQLAESLAQDGDSELSDHVVDALLNHETSFFRDATVMDLVADAAVGLRDGAPGRRLRIWCAGCSMGQEPLSLAMLLDERGLDESAVEIVATDVSQGAIARARSGDFSQFEIQRGLSVRRMMRWFEGDDDRWTARRELLRRIHFRQENIVGAEPATSPFDIILCRNVLLYFSPATREEAYRRFANSLRPDGVLSLGAGETVIGQTELFVPSERWRGLYSPA